MSTDPNAVPAANRTSGYRGGAPWDLEECGQLVDELRAGMTLEALADAHGRTVSGVTGRLALMVPAEDDTVPKGRRQRVEWLRERLADEPDYDWRSPLSAALNPYHRLWSPEEEAVLRDGWDQRRPLAELAASCQVEEHVMARRLVQMGLAEDLVEVTDRLGFTGGGVAAARRAVALDAAKTRVVVLVLLADGNLLHVSVHTRDEDAIAVRDAVVAEQRETGVRREIIWSIAPRQVEDCTVGTKGARTGQIRVQGDVSLTEAASAGGATAR